MSDDIKNKKVLNKSKVAEKVKKFKPSEKLLIEVKKQEKELSFIRNLLTNKETRDVEISKLQTKKVKNPSLKPISRESNKPVVNKSSKPYDNEKNLVPNMAGKKINEWKDNKSNMEDYQLRRTLTKKSEKVEIDCDSSFKSSIEKISQFKMDNKLGNMIEDMVKNEYSELIDFLNSLGMIKYFESFQKNLIDDLATILEIQESHLEEMKICEEDRQIILKEIKALRMEEQKFYETSNNNRNKEDNFYESLPDDGVDQNYDDNDKYSFLKALQEFTINTKVMSNVQKSDDRVNIESSISKKESDKAITKNNSILNETSIDCFENNLGEMKFFLPINAKKSCCWVCLKLITNDKLVIFEKIKDKHFCTGKCMQSYIDRYFIKCSNSTCNNEFEKVNGENWCKNCQMEKQLTHISQVNEKEKSCHKTLKTNDSNEVMKECYYDPMLDF